MDVNDPPSSLSSQNHQLLAGIAPLASAAPQTSQAGILSPLKLAQKRFPLHIVFNRGNGEVIHMDQNGTKVSFTLTNVANAAGVDEPDLARVHDSANIDRGINTTRGNAPDSGESYNQFLEILPNEKAKGQLQVSFEGTDNAGNSWSNPVYDLGFYLMGRRCKQNCCGDTNGSKNLRWQCRQWFNCSGLFWPQNYPLSEDFKAGSRSAILH